MSYSELILEFDQLSHEVEEALAKRVEKLTVTKFQVSQLQKEIEQALEDIKEGVTQTELLVLASAILQELLDKVSGENIRKIEVLVNTALNGIFTDMDLTFKIESSVKRNVITYRFVVYEDGEPGDISSYGGGVFAIIAFVLKLIFNVVSQSYPLIFLDEQLSYLSAHYIAGCSQLLEDLSREFGIILTLITHKDTFSDFADLLYKVRKVKGITHFELKKAGLESENSIL